MVQIIGNQQIYNHIILPRSHHYTHETPTKALARMTCLPLAIFAMLTWLLKSAVLLQPFHGAWPGLRFMVSHGGKPSKRGGVRSISAKSVRPILVKYWDVGLCLEVWGNSLTYFWGLDRSSTACDAANQQLGLGLTSRTAASTGTRRGTCRGAGWDAHA